MSKETDVEIKPLNSKKAMRILMSITLMLIASITYAQKVYSVNYENQADVKVYVVKYENQADLKVYKIKYSSQAE